ncbi:DUF433 domain-containing protein [Halogeometricum sp. CBA1124]|uniref:DUF433 domain-containing protein n=1 Tax=Halogeometricum sp. CBA1124 TaxID=2668071 RepID=UPI00142A3355|nr:DUF433 domain-containing protein [Halogeometricum sp. CBA1124]MUV56240.1 DUF433 domain-containing protein [Halogeometricum sp. CBA1124]
MTIVSDANVRNGQPHTDGTDVTVQEVYAAYAREGLEPAEVASEYGISLADVHEALAYYYRHAERMREMEEDSEVETPPIDEFIKKNQDADEL